MGSPIRAVDAIHVAEPNTDVGTLCYECLFDAVLPFPVTALTEDGVADWGEVRICVRCWDQNHPAE